MRDINNAWDTLAKKRRNTVPLVKIPDKGRAIKGLVGGLQWLGSRAFGPSKRSGPRLLSTVPPEVLIVLYVQHVFTRIVDYPSLLLKVIL